jgi:hypothetical protein
LAGQVGGRTGGQEGKTEGSLLRLALSVSIRVHPWFNSLVWQKSRLTVENVLGLLNIATCIRVAT